MSWQIKNLVNTVKISRACAKELFVAQEKLGLDIWYNLGEVAYKGAPTFNSDHAEHGDWLRNEDSADLVAILKKHKVKGDICFGCTEGDEDGYFWGYRFDGKGQMTNLVGRFVWTDVDAPLTIDDVSGKTFVITGTLQSMTRDEAEHKICCMDADSTKSVSERVDYIVVGDNPGSKLQTAEKLGIRKLTEDDFIKLTEQIV